MVSKAVPRTKSEVLAHIAAETGLHRRQVAWVLDSMNGMIDKSLKREGVFAIPGLVKLKVVKKPATKARKGVNPFTGEPMMFRAKPASKKVKAVALKNLKNMVA
jgi:nucleoid DNA-binding protein